MSDRCAPIADERIVRTLSGPAKIAALLKAQRYTYRRFAREFGFGPTDVKLCVYGLRPYPKVREALAQLLDLPREEIDSLLGSGASTGDPAPKTASQYSARAGDGAR